MLGRIHKKIRAMKCDNCRSTDKEQRNQSQPEMRVNNVISAFLHESRQAKHFPQVLPPRPIPLDYANIQGQVGPLLSKGLDLLPDEDASGGPIVSGIEVSDDENSQSVNRFLIEAGQ